MFNSFLKRSAFCGPTPFKYSIGLANICDEKEIIDSLSQIYVCEIYGTALANILPYIRNPAFL